MTGATGSESALARPVDMVLVHGAFHGGWCWQRVRPRLERAGHRVYAPSHTGLGDRRHLLSKDIDMETFVDDIVSILEFEELERVVMVGHSFGGRTLGLVADRCPERLAHLVFLDAGLSTDGRSRLEAMTPEQREARVARAMAFDGGLSVPPPPAEAFGLSDPADIAWVERHLTPQPLGPEASPTPLRAELGNGIAATYLHCVEPEFPGTATAADYAKDRQDWVYRTIPTCHDAMVSAPNMLAGQLLAIAATVR